MRKRTSRRTTTLNNRNVQKTTLPTYNPVRHVDSMEKQVVKDAMASGPGKRGRIYYRIPKKQASVIKIGYIIQDTDGLYQVSEIRPGSSCQSTSVIICSSFDPKNISDKQILRPKKF